MKKLLLLLSAAAITSGTQAQQRVSSILFNDKADLPASTPQPQNTGATIGHLRGSGGNARTTSTPTSRWYKYTDFLSANYTTAVSGTYLWNDTTSVDVYTGPSGNEYLFNTIVSVGLVCDPFVAGWNDPLAYPGEMELTTASAYTIDTVYIHGTYYRNNAKLLPVDTLNLALIYGDGSLPTDLHAVARDTIGGNEWIYTEYGVDTLHYIRMPYDSVDNRADTFQGGVTPVLRQLLLTSSDTALNYEAYIPMSISVPAGGNMPALSLTFKSGDASFTFGDTVFTGSTAVSLYKYGMFRPACVYQTSSGTTATFPANTASDQNQGEFRYSGHGAPHHIYTPQWFWISGVSNAAQLQYPDFAFHINCATCDLATTNMEKNNVVAKAIPNPASNLVVINFSLSAAADVSVTLTNVMGQVFAVENIANVDNGKVSFNTSSMPTGVYFYTISANAERKTGRVVIAH
jgi:hypothetical protein